MAAAAAAELAAIAGWATAASGLAAARSAAHRAAVAGLAAAGAGVAREDFACLIITSSSATTVRNVGLSDGFVAQHLTMRPTQPGAGGLGPSPRFRESHSGEPGRGEA